MAQVMEGTELRLGERRDRWRQATLEAWIWSRSVRRDDRDGFDLVVSASDGENLRATPNGRIVARARSGMLLERIEADGNWVRVRRTAWIWEPSLRIDRADPPPARADPPPPADEAAAREFAAAGPVGMVIMDRTGADTLGRVHPGRSVEVLAREGDRVRVRVEGWVYAAGLAADDTAGAAVARGLTRAQLRDEPERYRGRLVEWAVQFIALQQAERFRSDFMEGEVFILARGPDGDPGFVYLAVPPERVEEVRALAPLQRIRILGRVRTPVSAVTDAPVIDLLEITGRGPRP